MRAFNRFYTRILGLLDEGLLATPYTLTEARVLFELAHRGPVEVLDLRRDLRLDAGYASRILARFATDGLIERSRSADDGRRQRVELTPAGRTAAAELDRRSAEQIGRWLDPMADAERDRLLDAMGAIQGILGNGDEAAPPPEVVLRAPKPGELGWVVQRHGAVYAAEYGWDTTFEALVARIVADFVADPSDGQAVWIAEVAGEPAGCVFCVRADGRTAQLRLLLVEPSARGLGVGAALVDRCLVFARDAGYRRITLWTNDVLHAARRIYQRAGFELVDQSPHHSFGHDLVGQNWAREL